MMLKLFRPNVSLIAGTRLSSSVQSSAGSRGRGKPRASDILSFVLDVPGFIDNRGCRSYILNVTYQIKYGRDSGDVDLKHDGGG
jgi:hypothetical protein